MPRLFIEKGHLRDGEVILSPSETHHVRNVLRMKQGDSLILFDGEGNEYRGRIHSLRPREVRVWIDEQRWVTRESIRRMALLQALIKGDRMDEIVQKGCELGFQEFHPFLSERSVVRYDSERAFQRRLRWQKIAIEACKQCGRSLVPAIEGIGSMDEVLARLPSTFTVRVLLWEEAKGKGMKEFLRGLRMEGLEGAALLVGPEGGFTGEEVRLAEREGFVAVRLGKRILRSTTASVVAMGILQYELGDLGSL